MAIRNHSSVVAYMARKRREIIDGVIRDVAALPGVDSPEAMLVTADELRAILLARLSIAPSSN